MWGWGWSHEEPLFSAPSPSNGSSQCDFWSSSVEAIRGVPPKLCDWITIKEIASSLGKLSEINWQSLFSSFFSIIRVKIKCKDPKMIPCKRVVEMEDQLFMLHFKVEDAEQEPEKPTGDEGKGDDPDDEDDNLLDDDLG
uniref:DUF4283 domain-containing protein n=1 Tax=Setaria italica TaxID=4555 RepID=K3YDT1_SETIT